MAHQRARSMQWLVSLTVVVLLLHALCATHCSCFATGSASSATYSRMTMSQALSRDAKPKATLALPQPRGILNRVLFNWSGDLLRKGNKQVLELEDLWLLPEESRMAAASSTFDALHRKAQADIAQTQVQAQVRVQAQAPAVAQGTGLGTPSRATGGHMLSDYAESPLIHTIVHMYRGPLVWSGLCKLVNTCVQFLPSLLVARILTATEATASAATPALAAVSRQAGVRLSLLLFLALSLKTMFENQYFFMVTNAGTNIRGTITAAIYKKAMRLAPGGNGKTLGEIVNYMQLDASRMEAVATSVHVLWDGLLQILGFTGLLLYFLGPSVFAGILVLMGVIPLNAYFYKKLSSKRAEMLRYTDERVKITNEILQGIRAIKSFNWERAFEARLREVRRMELKSLREGANYRAILVSFMSAAPSIVAIITLALYTFLGNDLSPAKVFSSLALFNQLRFPLIFYPMVINTYSEGKISLQRLTTFFAQDEVVDYVDRYDMSVGANGDGDRGVAVEVAGGSFSWTSGDADSARGGLHGVDLQVRRGDLIAVVGSVGSGKSTLLHAILSELHKTGGAVSVAGSVAYVPQQAWIPNETLRDVILFGKPMKPDRYRAVVKACGLSQDLTLLEAGDATEIGEKGINLSGGQKQRVSIARAVYDDADVYLLDDPLSALDSSVGASVFRDCIQQQVLHPMHIRTAHSSTGTTSSQRPPYLASHNVNHHPHHHHCHYNHHHQLSGKTRILVTNQMQVLPYVDRIVLMDKDVGGPCRILDQGTLAELTARGHDLSKLTVAARGKGETETETERRGEVGAVAAASAVEQAAAEAVPAAKSALEVLSTAPVEVLLVPVHMSMPAMCVDAVTSTGPTEQSVAVAAAVASSTAVASATAGKLIVAEERAEGAVGWPAYRRYLGAVRQPVLMGVLLASFVLANFSNIFQQWVMAAWTNDVGYVRRPLGLYLFGMASTAAGVAGFNWARTYLGCMLGAAASERLHSDMARRVLSAPLRFFESTPIGRLIQRFSKDIDALDQMLPQSFGQVVSSALNIVAAMLAMFVVTPAFALVMVPVFAAYLAITGVYRPVTRELKRLDSLSRSPIYAHFSESLSGLPVIRSFRKQSQFEASNQAKVDDNLSSYFALKAVDRWLCVRLEYVGNTIVLVASLLVVMAGQSSGPAGISLNNALSITSLLNWAVRNGADTENLMNSAERIFYTSSETPQERNFDLTLPKFQDPAAHPTETGEGGAAVTQLNGWPWRGGLELTDVSMRYRQDFVPVLRGVSVTIPPGQSVGVVGRTGSGKSSIFRAILRLTELDSGSILVDGVDVADVDMERLRSSVAVITQDPVLFSGTIRFNLDPFRKNTDAELLFALGQVNLGSTVGALPGGLDFAVTEGGEKFSSGQRQLICLARALVRRPRLLLLDEATSSVDYQTDEIIQRTIRTVFDGGDCTVVTIAHRLRTVMDADKLIVMDAGSVAEQGSPAQLLRDPHGIFFSLVEAEAREDAGGGVRAGIGEGGGSVGAVPDLPPALRDTTSPSASASPAA